MPPSDVPVARYLHPRYPVVFMHGMGLLGHILKPGRVFDTIVEHLRDRGFVVFGPRVQPYNRTEVRAGAWVRHFEQVMETTGHDRLNLFGFSTGGLDARYVISCLGGHRYVASLTTLAAPHRGSSLPLVPLGFPEPLRRAVLAVVEALAYRIFPMTRPDAEATLRELTPDQIQHRFNPFVPDHPDVAYYSMAARAGKGAPRPASPLLWPLNRIMYAYEGVNDGFVSVHSARWSGFERIIEADHAQLIGILDGLGSFDANRFYEGWLRTLAERGH